MNTRTVLVTTLLTSACAAELTPVDPPTPTTPPGPVGLSRITSVDVGRGLTASVVDARDAVAWVYLDLDSGGEVTASDPTWDLAFRRFVLMLDGGVSGDGDVALVVDDVGGLEGLTRAPAGPWVTDAVDGDDEDAGPDLAFQSHAGGWFDYDVATHTLTPKDRVYFVRSNAGRGYKLQLSGYYDDAGTPGWLAFRWGPVELSEPLPADALVLDGSTEWVHLSLAERRVVAADAPWDLAVTRTRWRTRSGDSGEGLGGARIAPARFDQLTLAPTHGYTIDAEAPVAGPSGGTESGNTVLNAWYDYDLATHAVSPKPQTYLVRGGRGDYAKLDILAYAEGKTTVRIAPLPRVMEVLELEVDATSPRYVSLRDGAIVEVTTASASTTWDVRLHGVLLGTCSGASGPGGGGAIDVGRPFDEVRGSPSGEVVVDTLLPLPGPPGSGEAPGNAALATWYDYDPATHTVSPRDTAYVIRTADGGWAKLEITSYTRDVYRLRIAYAGAGVGEL